MLRRTTVAVTAATALMMGLTACNGESPQAVPASSSTPAAATAEDQAIQAVNDYLDIYSQFEKGTETDLNLLEQVAGDPLLSGARDSLQERQEARVTNVGESPVVVPGSVRIVRSEVPDRGEANIEVTMCLDQSEVRFQWPNGDSIPNEVDRVKRQWWVRASSWPEPDWRVLGQSAEVREPCDG